MQYFQCRTQESPTVNSYVDVSLRSATTEYSFSVWVDAMWSIDRLQPSHHSVKLSKNRKTNISSLSIDWISPNAMRSSERRTAEEPVFHVNIDEKKNGNRQTAPRPLSFRPIHCATINYDLRQQWRLTFGQRTLSCRPVLLPSTKRIFFVFIADCVVSWSLLAASSHTTKTSRDHLHWLASVIRL